MKSIINANSSKKKEQSCLPSITPSFWVEMNNLSFNCKLFNKGSYNWPFQNNSHKYKKHVLKNYKYLKYTTKKKKKIKKFAESIEVVKILKIVKIASLANKNNFYQFIFVFLFFCSF